MQGKDQAKKRHVEAGMNELDISTTIKPSACELLDLFKQTTWAVDRSANDIERLVDRLEVFVCVRRKGQLVGFGRALSDGVYRALLDDLVVDEQARGMGLGKVIVSSLLAQLSTVERVFLNAAHHLAPFYMKCGFQVFEGRTMVLTKEAEDKGV